MRKQMKIAAVVSAAALLALGASITSFAAQKGTWKYEDGEWYCYDKNGDVYSNTFCLSNGKEFYVGDSGEMVTSSWVDYEGELYFVNSSGQKIVNDWRLTTPYEDDSADEEWYYFQSTGKMAKTKKLTIKGKTYFFDGDGQMLTGWVTADGVNTVDEAGSYEADHTYYCDETGARLEKAWVKTIAPGVDEEDTDADEYYYYLKASGKVATGKQANIKGQTYFFDDLGKMLTGWVASTGSNQKSYVSIQGDDDNEDYYELLSSVAEYGGKAYFAGDEDDGHMKKNKWIKLWNPKNAYDEDEDNDKVWFWIEKDGKVYVPSDADAVFAKKYKLEDGDLVQDGSKTANVVKKKVNSKDYFFNTEGEMVTKFIKVEEDGTDLKKGMYYFGGTDDGTMKTGAQSIKDNNDDTYKFYFETKSSETQGTTKGMGVTGNKSGKLYYMGQLVIADDYRYEIAELNGYYFIINKNGAIQHSKTEYKEDGDVLVDARGTYDKDSKKYKEVPEFVKSGMYKDGLDADNYGKLVNVSTNEIDVVSEYVK